MLGRALRIIAGLIIGGAVIVGGIWVLALSLEDRAPKYDGKDAYDWAASLRSPDAAVANAARLVVTNRVVPALRDQMFHDTHDSQLKLKLVELLNSLPHVFITAVEASSRRYEAARSLGEFGADAAPAIPDLIRCVKGPDSTVRPGAIEALGKIRTEPGTVIPLLTECLDDPDEDIQLHAAQALAEYGPQANAAVPKLLPLLKAHSKELPPAARKALQAIDPSALAASKANKPE